MNVWMTEREVYRTRSYSFCFFIAFTVPGTYQLHVLQKVDDQGPQQYQNILKKTNQCSQFKCVGRYCLSHQTFVYIVRPSNFSVRWSWYVGRIDEEKSKLSHLPYWAKWLEVTWLIPVGTNPDSSPKMVFFYLYFWRGEYMWGMP